MKYSTEITNKICEEIRSGNGRIQSAKKAGINPSTFFDWIKKYSNFNEAIKSAEEIGETYVKEVCIKTILRAAVENEQWQAAAWILERRYPKEYGKRVELDNKQPPAPPVFRIEVTKPQYSDELQKLFDGVDELPANVHKLEVQDDEHAKVIAAICSEASGQAVQYTGGKQAEQPASPQAPPQINFGQRHMVENLRPTHF